MNNLVDKGQDIVYNSIRHNYLCISTHKDETVKRYEITLYDENDEPMHVSVADCTDAFKDVGERLVHMHTEIKQLKNRRWWKWWKS